MRNKMKIEIQESTYILAVFLLFLIPLRWLIAWLIAIATHEFCHYISSKWLGGKILKLTIGVYGMKMDAVFMSEKRKVIAILCGPLFGLFPVLFRSKFPELAVCCWMLSLYNILPLPSLDGGNVLCVLCKNQRCVTVVRKIVLSMITLTGLLCTLVWHLGVLPLIAAVMLWIRNRKNPCQESICEVQ